jgi:hypothetical protein
MWEEREAGSEVAPTIRAVILDYGEVLCQRPKAEALHGMASELGMDPARFIALYGTSRDLVRSTSRGVLAWKWTAAGLRVCASWIPRCGVLRAQK